MKNNNQGIQKYSLSEILKQDFVTKEQYFQMTEEDQHELLRIANQYQQDLKGTARDEHYKKFWELIPKDNRSSLWESNHVRIINSIHKDLIDHGNMPTVTRLQELTGISRKTISKHLKEYKQSEFYQNIKDEFQILHSQVLKVVYRMAVKEDIRACKLFLEVTGDVNKSTVGTYIERQQNNHTQNNFSPIEVKIIPPSKE